MAGNNAASTSANRRVYERRINRVMDYVSQNLTEPLTLDKLAGVAAFSPFHFHRVFKSHTGESLNNFIQRVRLETAARALRDKPQLEVTEIALDAGFGSSSSFAHAFKNHFGMNASEWRAQGVHNLREARWLEYSNLNQTNRKTEQADNGSPAQNWSQEELPMNAAVQTPAVQTPMKVEIKTLPDFHVAYMRNVGPYGPTEIPPLWQKLMAWAQAQGLTSRETLTLGIAYDDPEVTPPHKCRYDACIVVPLDVAADGNVGLKDVPGGRYAVYEYVGTSNEIMQAWSRMFSTWLPSSGYQPDSRPCFELYRADSMLDQPPGAFRCDICVPVKPL